MNIASLKLWHWLLIGLTIGLAFATVRVLTGASTALDDRPGMPLPQFASILNSRTPDGKPYFRNLTLYPPLDGKVFVTGEFPTDRNNPDGPTRPFQLNTPIPYKLPQAPAPASPTYSLRDHLAQNHPDLPYTYAWWTADSIQYLLWPTAFTITIGLLWPLTLRLLLGPSYWQKPNEPNYDLDRFSHAPDPTHAPAPSADPTAIEAYNTALSTKVGPAVPTTPTPFISTTPVPSLTNTPLDPPLPDAPEDPTDYKGEFYPVALPTHKAD